MDYSQKYYQLERKYNVLEFKYNNEKDLRKKLNEYIIYLEYQIETLSKLNKIYSQTNSNILNMLINDNSINHNQEIINRIDNSLKHVNNDSSEESNTSSEFESNDSYTTGSEYDILSDEKVNDLLN
ncbi:hypothetical protein H012_gp234 [Acanthamoeba polyphaga moumouvirus]|uniref:Uncharacterized protein n=2 Tax=Moumouvirus TaxID=3080801 RepID=L7RDQ5_9VIRU|nr:hypothetical protein H012_gp234 [Acanthamoeba polyphaga moumouvirus]AEX62445.1 hypothetical protein mv_R240 [Moumouvirus Monve]AGC02218.1 hypothetical protein Moumou_00697 [Acanthamoeba polyphaga moumouvirus]